MCPPSVASEIQSVAHDLSLLYDNILRQNTSLISIYRGSIGMSASPVRSAITSFHCVSSACACRVNPAFMRLSAVHSVSLRCTILTRVLTMPLTAQEYALGKYPELGLSDARARAREWRSLIKAGIDPRNPTNVPSFRSCAQTHVL